MGRQLLEAVRRRRGKEIGPVCPGGGDLHVALIHPTPYHVAMSSLGFQTLYRLLNERADTVCERTFLPDDVKACRGNRTRLFTYESERLVARFDVVALSVAYELELPGVLDVLDLSGVPVERKDRNPRDPLVIAGGPLTISNPLPLAPFVDVVLVGEAEEALDPLVDALITHRSRDGPTRDVLLETLGALPGFYVPALHGDTLPVSLVAPACMLPAYSVFTTPETELANMFLIEAERGCSRGCTYCIMRREASGGMRVVPRERILERIPEEASRVGLVGAAVTDHPELGAILESLVSRGKRVGISSLRADRLSLELVRLLHIAGYRRLTVGRDGASERLRGSLGRRIRETHLLAAARWASEVGMIGLKVYVMLGVPGESEEDVGELIRFSRELGEILPVVLGVAFFVSKKNTPLDGHPFEDIKVLSRRLKRLTRAVKPDVEVRPVSARWAWIEYLLAQGGPEMGLVALEAWRNGGSFAAWKRAVGGAGEKRQARWR